MSDGPGHGVGRRRILAAVAATATLGGVAGCRSSGSDGYRVRMGADGDWRSLTPVETGSSHRDAYCGSDEDACETARHGLDRGNAVSLFVNRDATGEDPDDALVVTYDTPDDSGGTAELTLDEPIALAEDVVVADGPVDKGETRATRTGRTGSRTRGPRTTPTAGSNSGGERSTAVSLPVRPNRGKRPVGSSGDAIELSYRNPQTPRESEC